MNYPTDRAGRRAHRKAGQARIQARADYDIAAVGTSLKCRGYGFAMQEFRHVDHPDGCKGGPANCLCECHDPREDA